MPCVDKTHLLSFHKLLRRATLVKRTAYNFTNVSDVQSLIAKVLGNIFSVKFFDTR